jgi:hypothetical protein
MTYSSRVAAALLAALVVGACAKANLAAQPTESRPLPPSQVKLAQGRRRHGGLHELPQARRRQAEDALRQGGCYASLYREDHAGRVARTVDIEARRWA